MGSGLRAIGEVKTAVLTSVRSILNHSAECELLDLAKADYRDGKNILTAKNGRRLFSRIDMDDDNVMRDFSERDAKAFVRVLRLRMARGVSGRGVGQDVS